MAIYVIRFEEGHQQVSADEHKYEMISMARRGVVSTHSVLKLIKQGKTVGTYRIRKIVGWHIQ